MLGAIKDLWCRCAGCNRGHDIMLCAVVDLWYHCAGCNRGRYDIIVLDARNYIIVLGAIEEKNITVLGAIENLWCHCARRNSGNNIIVLGTIEGLWYYYAGRNRGNKITVLGAIDNLWCHCAGRNQGPDVIVLGAIKDMISLCWAQSRTWCHCAGRNRGHYDHFAHKMVFQYVYVKYSMDVWLVKTILYWLLKNEKRYEIKTYWRYFLLLPVTRALRAVCMIS